MTGWGYQVKPSEPFPSSAFLLGKGRQDRALAFSLGAQPAARDLIQESIYGICIHIEQKDMSVGYSFTTPVIKANWTPVQLQKLTRSTCPTFEEFDIKT